MSQNMTQTHPAPTGLNARFFGQSVPVGGTSYSYWVQALGPDGIWSELSGVVTIANCPASFDHYQFAAIGWNPVPGAVLYNLFQATSTTQPGLAANLQYQGTAPNYTSRGQGAFNSALVAVPYAGLRFAQARYDFAIDGGLSTSASTSLANSDTIPLNAIIVAVVISVGTALAGPTDIEFGLSGMAAGTLLGATAIGSVTGIIPGLGTFAAPVKVTTASVVTAKVTVAVATAGTIDFYILYIQSPD